MIKIIPVILSGGSGTRLWPVSKKNMPKQYLSLISKYTMLQETLMRLSDFEGLTKPIIVCSHNHVNLIKEQCNQINVDLSAIILEPFGRNTAPAIAAASLTVKKLHNEGILIVLSADHYIQDKKLFYDSIGKAINQAKNNKLVIFGIKPDSPNTNYGYIKYSKQISDDVYMVDAFTEKPTLDLAKSYIDQDKYLWNSGMFVFKSQIMIEMLEYHVPKILEHVELSLKNAVINNSTILLEDKIFRLCESISIDYAVLEKSNKTVVVSLHSKWCDVGSWSALHDLAKKDINKNAIIGNASLYDSKNNYINTTDKLIAAIGINDMVVVNTNQATFISPLNKSHNIGKFVDQIEGINLKKYPNADGLSEKNWGSCKNLISNDYFDIKVYYLNGLSSIKQNSIQNKNQYFFVISGELSLLSEEISLKISKNESKLFLCDTEYTVKNTSENQLIFIKIINSY